MSKVAVALGVVLVGSAASVGGVYLSNMNNFDSQLPKDIQEFDDKGQDEGCVQNLFAGLEKMGTTSDSPSGNINSNFLSSTDKKSTEGCLVINGNRENFGSDSNKKGKGKFRFLWSVKRATANKGFVVFASAEPVENNKKFKGTGSAYTLEKKENENKGISTKKVEIKNGSSDGKELEFKGQFPSPKIVDTTGWGFGDSDDNNLCGNGDCQLKGKQSDVSFEGYGTGKGEAGNDTKKLGEGSDNLEAWWKNTFGESTGNMKEVIKDMKGNGTNKVIWYGQ